MKGLGASYETCAWVPQDNKLYCDYHDLEWGRPVYDDRALFELLCLELSVRLILVNCFEKKNASLQKRFHHYDIELWQALVSRKWLLPCKCSNYPTQAKANSHCQQCRAAVQRLQQEYGSFPAIFGTL
ncbi:DNA-3-methyladenine glycosylase I [Streptococcus equi]|uniref:DNA-3-methyladenine glycosylase I n=1 Tax=Streptococcus equi TaxID=1336 RepID=UPI0039C7377D